MTFATEKAEKLYIKLYDFGLQSSCFVTFELGSYIPPSATTSLSLPLSPLLLPPHSLALALLPPLALACLHAAKSRSSLLRTRRRTGLPYWPPSLSLSLSLSL